MPVLIAAKPDRMRESLRILLRLVDGVDVVGQASDENSALRLIVEHRPLLVLLDTNLPGAGLSSILNWLEHKSASIRSLVLADNIRVGQEAHANGADAVLIKGFSTATLLETVKSLLPQAADGTSQGTGGE